MLFQATTGFRIVKKNAKTKAVLVEIQFTVYSLRSGKSFLKIKKSQKNFICTIAALKIVNKLDKLITESRKGNSASDIMMKMIKLSFHKNNSDDARSNFQQKKR